MVLFNPNGHHDEINYMNCPAASCEVAKSIFSPLSAADYNSAPRGVEFDPWRLKKAAAFFANGSK
jgi:hypothetical protein